MGIGLGPKLLLYWTRTVRKYFREHVQCCSRSLKRISLKSFPNSSDENWRRHLLSQGAAPSNNVHRSQRTDNVSYFAYLGLYTLPTGTRSYPMLLLLSSPPYTVSFSFLGHHQEEYFKLTRSSSLANHQFGYCDIPPRRRTAPRTHSTSTHIRQMNLVRWGEMSSWIKPSRVMYQVHSAGSYTFPWQDYQRARQLITEC